MSSLPSVPRASPSPGGGGSAASICELPGWGDAASPPPGSRLATLADLPPPGAGLSHMAQKADEKGIVPPCTLEFSAQRRRVGVGAMDVEGEAPHDRQVLRGVVLPGTVAVLVQDDVENPVQLVLDRPMRALDAQQFPGGNVLPGQEVPDGPRLGPAALPPPSQRHPHPPPTSRHTPF